MNFKNPGFLILVALICSAVGIGVARSSVQDNTYFLNSGSGSGCSDLDCLTDVVLIDLEDSQILIYNSTSGKFENENQTATVSSNATCTNLGTGKIVCASYDDNNLNFKSFKGSPDISVTNDSNTIIIDYNGTLVSDDTSCSNVGSGIQVYKTGECIFRTLIGSPDISIVQGTDTITIDYNGTLVTESTSASNVGSQANVFKNQTGTVLYFKTLLATKGISVTNGTNTITFNTNFVNGTGIKITGSTAQTFSTNLANGTGISITGATQQTVTNTGVISLSCSVGITCSGTNPATVTPDYQLLCTNSLNSGATSISCSSFTGKKFILIDYSLILNSTNTITSGMQFNSDTGNNYAYRTFNNGATDTGATSQSNLRLNGNALVASSTTVGQAFCLNISTQRKVCNGESTTEVNGGATTTTNYTEYSFKWANTSNQITTVTIMRGAGTGFYTTGSQITVFGHD